MMRKPLSLSAEIKKDKDIRIPIWQYTGLEIIGLIIGFAIVMNTIEKRTELEYLSILRRPVC